MRLNSDGNISTDNTSLNAGEITPSDNVDNAREWSQHDPAVVLVAAADHVHQPMATEKERARSPRYAQTHRGTRVLPVQSDVRVPGPWSEKRYAVAAVTGGTTGSMSAPACPSPS